MLNDVLPDNSELEKLGSMMEFVTLIQSDKGLKGALDEIIAKQDELKLSIEENRKLLDEKNTILDATERAVKENNQKIGKAKAALAASEESLLESTREKQNLAVSYREFSQLKEAQEKHVLVSENALLLREKSAEDLEIRGQKALSAGNNLKKDYGQKLDKLREIVG